MVIVLSYNLQPRLVLLRVVRGEPPSHRHVWGEVGASLLPMDGLSNPTSCVRHRYGSSFISAPMPTIPSMINTSRPITIQPCNAVMFSSFELMVLGLCLGRRRYRSLSRPATPPTTMPTTETKAVDKSRCRHGDVAFHAKI